MFDFDIFGYGTTTQPEQNLEIDEDDQFGAAKLKSAAVVNIQITLPRDFGKGKAGATNGTGFVVDKERGIILSNKHIVTEGPLRAKGVFLNYEEIDLYPCYRDPVHDFGFFRFDPSKLKDTPSVEIKLLPGIAKPGMKVLLIGNNESEKLTYIELTISRIDRPAMIGLDLNTFYLTSADSSVGGSSGSPLLNKNGKAVAIMAAGSHSTSYMLPLERISRSLEYLKENKDILRGTLQIYFKYQSFESLIQRKLISTEIINKVKQYHIQAKGLLLVDRNLPKGSGRISGLENGDVLISLKGDTIFDYLSLADILDTFIDQTVEFTVLRHLNEVKGKVRIQNLKEIEPDRLVEVSNGVFHQIPFELAMNHNLPIEGVFIASSGYMFNKLPNRGIIKKLGKKTISNLDDFVEVIKKLDNGEIVSVVYHHIGDPNQSMRRMVTVDKRWYPFQVGVRNDKEGRWDFQDVTSENTIKTQLSDISKPSIPSAGENTGTDIDEYRNSIVSITISKPFSVDGDTKGSRLWAISKIEGLIVDSELGLIITSSNALSTTLLDVQVMFNEARIIPAKVIYISPLENKPITVLKYNPKLLENDITVKVIDISLSDQKPLIGDEYEYIGFSQEDEFERLRVQVKAFSRDEMSETVKLSSFSGGSGIYLDEDTRKAKILGITNKLVLSYKIHDIVQDAKDSIARERQMKSAVKFLPVTLNFINLAEARINGLSKEWAYRLQCTFTKYERKLLEVNKRMAATDAYEKLADKDIILAIDWEPVTLIAEYHRRIIGKNHSTLTLLRDGNIIEEKVKLTSFSTIGTSRIIHFVGLIVQDPHPQLFFNTKQEYIKNGGVYVTHKQSGSPAQTAENSELGYVELEGRLIVRVDESDIKDLQDFEKAISRVKHLEFVRLVGIHPTTGDELVLDIKLDLEYWKSIDMFLNENLDWESRIIEHDS